MKLCTYASSSGPRVGVISEGRVFDAQTSRTMSDIIADWPKARPVLETTVKQGEGIPLASAKLLAPIARPGKIFAIGLNYADHIAESRMEAPELSA